ncbi:hypothetical protein BD779DRAFT_1480899 [Infundibulicybe gibba]|nr:hypothetical protein BD779DRAFT_1480899 [Infundibulicybe gibba]
MSESAGSRADEKALASVVRTIETVWSEHKASCNISAKLQGKIGVGEGSVNAKEGGDAGTSRSIFSAGNDGESMGARGHSLGVLDGSGPSLGIGVNGGVVWESSRRLGRSIEAVIDAGAQDNVAGDGGTLWATQTTFPSSPDGAGELGRSWTD